MSYSLAILFLLASLGVVNGFLLSGYLFAKSDRGSDKWYLGLLLFTLCIRIGKSILVYFDPDVHKTILQIGLTACAFIGPLYLLYSAAHLDQRKVAKWVKRTLPPLALGLVVVGVAYPYVSRPDLWNGPIIVSIYSVWVAGLLIGLWIARKRLMTTAVGWAKADRADRRFLVVALGMLFITATYQFAWLISGFTYIWGALLFTGFFYYLSVSEFLQAKFNPVSKSKPKPTPSDLEALHRIDQLIRSQGLHKNPKLKLDDLAEATDLNRNEVSRILNVAYPNGFAHYIMQFRIEEAKKLILTRDELSLEGIGFEAGFNSKSSFFARFKEFTGKTPAQFKKEHTIEIARGIPPR